MLLACPLKTVGHLPKPLGLLNGIEFLLLPPILLVTETMQGTVVDGAEGYHPFIADLAIESPRLGITDVVGVAWITTTDYTVS